ncbi:hypothetical protein B9Z19DRAFT_1129965 [Tuber borchii]|uniref:Uncharacterized protein n=1 Tax=Tuber borchii TaxID=42251 RepID=A0A2T6ZL88_TUBBO|nr:hypothetical protein B9Z19DRAFT_1129965 [Tuber borchii]
MDPLSQIPTTTVTENYKKSRNSDMPNALRMMVIPIDNTHFTATFEESRIPTSESESERKTCLQDESVQRQRLEARISALENMIQEASLQAKSQVLIPILVNQKRNSNMMLDSASDQLEEIETILNPHTCSSREKDHDVELAMHESPSTTASGHSIPTHTYMDKGKRPAYSMVARGPALVQARFKSTTIGMAQEFLTQSNVQSSRHHPTNPVGKNDSQNSASTPLYLAGVPKQAINIIKQELHSKPISVQGRHIRNMSWIDRQILELLDDSNHAESMKNRIVKYSNYTLRKSFDPLCAESFHWEGDIAPESKKAFL